MKHSKIVQYLLEIASLLSCCLLPTKAQHSDRTTSCTVQASRAGNKATLTCHFPYPVATDNKTVQVAHRSPKHSNNTSVILDCYPQSGVYTCDGDTSYERQGNLTDMVKLSFVAGPGTEGFYSCYIMPATEHLYQECFFDRPIEAVKEIQSTEVDKKVLSTEVILGITAGVVALTLTLIVICYRQRCQSSTRKTCCKPCSLSCFTTSHEPRSHKITGPRNKISEKDTPNYVDEIGIALTCFCCSCTDPGSADGLDGRLPPSASSLEFGNNTPLSLADMDIHASFVDWTDENDNFNQIPRNSGIVQPNTDGQS